MVTVGQVTAAGQATDSTEAGHSAGPCTHWGMVAGTGGTEDTEDGIANGEFSNFNSQIIATVMIGYVTDLCLQSS